ncbi:MAG: hypothetical protein PHU25_06305 [Deltaproteobacteria bacterium]|nr:hypothetical protein [Deltaproteobacteria bacterium]
MTPRSNTDGAVYVEFLVVVWPLLLLFLGLAQLALACGAHLLVCHAAARAARAAIVILPDDHEAALYAGEPLNQVGSGAPGLETYAAASDGGRLGAVRNAARLTLAPVSPSPESFGSSSLAGAIASSGPTSIAAGLVGWTAYAAAVTFPDGNGGYRASFEPKGPVTVRVTFLFRCAVPVASAILCRRWTDLDPAAAAEISTNGNALEGLALANGWRLLALRAERTYGNQGR